MIAPRTRVRRVGSTHRAQRARLGLSLQKLLGHTQLSTTARYLHLSRRQMQKMPDLLAVSTEQPREVPNA